MPASPSQTSTSINRPNASSSPLPPEPLKPRICDSSNMASKRLSNSVNLQRRESRPIKSIPATTTSSPSGQDTSSSVQTRTGDTTFSLPIDIIDTPDLDELCLSPIGSDQDSRSGSPLSMTPVCILFNLSRLMISRCKGRVTMSGYGPWQP